MNPNFFGCVTQPSTRNGIPSVDRHDLPDLETELGIVEILSFQVDLWNSVPKWGLFLAGHCRLSARFEYSPEGVANVGKGWPI